MKSMKYFGILVILLLLCTCLVAGAGAVEASSAFSGYNAQKAVDYADEWWNKINPNYEYYPNADCANFVSQSLIAGGLTFDQYTDSKGSIRDCDNLDAWLKSKGYQNQEISKNQRPNEPIWFLPGDVAIFGDATDKYQHAVIAVTGDSNHYATVNAHTVNQYHKPIQFFYDHSNWDRCTFYHIADITATDTTSPTVNAFNVTPRSGLSSTQFTISYTISDTGGSGLKQVELWTATDTNGDGEPDWPSTPPHDPRLLSGGNGPISGSFYNTPPSSITGSYWYGLHVVDNAGNWNDERNSKSDGSPGVYGPIKVTITEPDTTLPTISITSPSNNQNFNTDTITVTGTAADNVGLRMVEVKVGSGSWMTASGTNSWTRSVNLAPGSNIIAARVFDTSDNIRETSVTVTYTPPDTTLPTISITSPSNNQNFNTDTITVTGTAADNVGLRKVEVKVGSGSWMTASGTNSWTRSVNLAPGSNIIAARVFDTSNNTRETSVTVTYTELPPKPIASFTQNSTSGTVPLTVQFTDTSMNTPTSWKWEYSAGEIWTQFGFGVMNPSHTFTTPGTYSIRLTVTNAGGSDTETKQDYITVHSAVQQDTQITIIPPTTSLATGQTHDYSVILDTAPAGLSGYNLTVRLTNPAVAEIVGIQFPAWVTLPTNSTIPADSVWCKSADLTGASGKTNITLVTVTLRGDNAGTTNITVLPDRIEDREGGRYTPSITDAILSVIATHPFPNPSGGFFPQPRDLNGNGLYEDLDGNGWIGFNDVVIYYNNLEAIDREDHGPVSFFDYDRNGWAGFNDIVLLYEVIV